MVGTNRIGMTCHKLEKMARKTPPLILAQHLQQRAAGMGMPRLGMNRLFYRETLQ